MRECRGQKTCGRRVDGRSRYIAFASRYAMCTSRMGFMSVVPVYHDRAAWTRRSRQKKETVDGGSRGEREECFYVSKVFFLLHFTHHVRASIRRPRFEGRNEAMVACAMLNTSVPV